MPSPLAMGAGASEGLDQWLAMQLAQAKSRMEQEQLNETHRKNLADEGLRGRGLDQGDWLKGAMVDDHNSQIATRDAALIEAGRERDLTDTFLADPAHAGSPEGKFLNARRMIPKGENLPYQLFTEPNGPRGPADPLEHVDVNGKDMLTPRSQAAGREGFHAPQQPQTSIIQTPGGYEVADRKAGTSKPLVNQGGNQDQLAPTAQTRAMSEGAQMLEPHIGKLAARAQALDQNGMFGPAMSRVRNIMSKYGSSLSSQDPDEQSKAWIALGSDVARDPGLNTDRNVGAFAASLGLMATGAGRVHGGARGGSSSQMLEHFKALLSDAGTLPMFLGRLDALDEYLTTYANGPHGGQDAGGGVDVYQEYLKRVGAQPKQ